MVKVILHVDDDFKQIKAIADIFKDVYGDWTKADGNNSPAPYLNRIKDIDYIQADNQKKYQFGLYSKQNSILLLQAMSGASGYKLAEELPDLPGDLKLNYLILDLNLPKNDAELNSAEKSDIDTKGFDPEGGVKLAGQLEGSQIYKRKSMFLTFFTGRHQNELLKIQNFYALELRTGKVNFVMKGQDECLHPKKPLYADRGDG